MLASASLTGEQKQLWLTAGDRDSVLQLLERVFDIESQQEDFVWADSSRDSLVRMLRKLKAGERARVVPEGRGG